MTHRLLLAADDPELARQVVALADESDGLEVIDTIDDLRRLGRVLSRTHPDVLVLHDARGSVTAFELVRELALDHRQMGIVVVVAEASPDVLRSAMQVGARDVLGLPLTLDDLEHSVRAAADWAATMRDRTAPETDLTSLAGRVIAVAGAKGGVGTTTVAIHLALAVVAAASSSGRERPVCLVDFDVRAGDVNALLGLPHRRSVSDLLEVAGELSGRHLQETLYTHRSGLRVLPAPEEGEQGLEVEVGAARNILGALRTRHDLVIVDAGSQPSDAAAAACELADVVLVVATPDGLALRGAQRLLRLWERLGVTGPDTRLLLNRASRKVEVQPALAEKIVGLPMTKASVPADFAAFEGATNTAQAERLEERRPREAFAALAAELDALPSDSEEVEDVDGGSASLLSRLAGERGQSTVETVGMLPVFLGVLLAMWQIGLVGYTFLLAGHSAREGVRALAVGDPEVAPIRSDVPGPWRDGLRCSLETDRVKVSLAVPIVLPGMDSPWRIGSSAATTVEDQPVADPAPESDGFRVQPAKQDPCRASEAKDEDPT